MPDQDWRTLPDGRRIPLNKPKGSSGATALAVGAVVVLGASGGTAGTAVLGGSAAGSTAVSAAESAVVRNIQSNLSKAKRFARKENPQRAWRQMRVRKGRERYKDAADCVAASFGQVQEFFLATPCQGLERRQYPITVETGSTMVVTVSKVTMRRASQAREFRSLIDEHGTGDIYPLAPIVSFTGHHYDSKPAGRSVIVAEAESLDGDPSDAVLQVTAEAATAMTS